MPLTHKRVVVHATIEPGLHAKGSWVRPSCMHPHVGMRGSLEEHPPLEEGPDREQCLQPVHRRCCHCCHHHHSKVDRWHMWSMVRIGAGAWLAWGCHCLQPVHQNCHHHHRHHCHSKVDGWHMRSTVRIGVEAQLAWGHRCRPAWGLVLGHHGHRIAKGARAESRVRQ
jgi:hypothetical protein